MATEATNKSVKTPQAPRWIRSYLPLITFGLAIFIGATILPSSLNLPQSNPSTVLEYAPVPPDDSTPQTSGEGSLSSLGLASSGGLRTGVRDTVEQAGKGGGAIKRAQLKDCVRFGNELKQTSDPNSPPCVPFFDGDNGGRTWQGVEEDEIRILVYTSASIFIDDNRGENSGSSPPGGSYCDLDVAPDTDTGCLEGDTQSSDHFRARVARIMSKYFNEHFQTYNRHVHVYLYYSNSLATASSRRSDAADNWERIKPFAVIDQAFFGGFNAAYAEALVRRRVMVFGSFAALENNYYKRNAPMIWSFWPDVEHLADLYLTYVCTKIFPYPVKNAGSNISFQNGDPRKYGLLYTSDPSFPGLRSLARLIEEGIKRCPNGAKANVVSKRTFPRAGWGVDPHNASVRAARENIADFTDKGVTTILWLGGMEPNHSQEAQNRQYFPEIIIAGDQFFETLDNGQAQAREVWRHAWVVTSLLIDGDYDTAPSRRVYREVEPQGSLADEDEASIVYRDYFLLFKSIQVAGPRLTPAGVDAGAHAIPRIRSTTPLVAACYYDEGDYSCVKDAQEQWWDPDAPDPQGRSQTTGGCWRGVSGGRRYVAGTWPEGPTSAFEDHNDPCSTLSYDTLVSTDLR